MRETREWRVGLALLNRPIWPLVNLIEMISLAGGFRKLNALLNELPDEIDMDCGVYSDPAGILAPYEDLIDPLLNPDDTFHLKILNGTKELSPIDAQKAYFKQKILERELEAINSLLCSPLGCNLCCTGPGQKDSQLFFEIPLTTEEVSIFNVRSLRDSRSLSSNPYEDPPLMVDGLPFYEKTPIIIYWSHGPGLILGKGVRCPRLSHDNRCTIYEWRPNTCRRPQIFPYVIDKKPDRSIFALENKLLAIIECPYVQALKAEIHTYASCSGLDLIIAPNKF